MGWAFGRPSLVAIEVAWRWLFGAPFLFVCWLCTTTALNKTELWSSLSSLDAMNPWLAARQLAEISAIFQPAFRAFVVPWLLPAALVWIAVSSLGRAFIFYRLDTRLPFRPLKLAIPHAAWLVLFALTLWGWYRAMALAAAAYVLPAGEPDLVAFSIWTIFLSLGFFTAFALLSWPFAIAPLLALLDGGSPLDALAQSFTLDKEFRGKLVEINLVMGIVKLALIVLAMVLSAAPLPFSDELGPGALHVVWAISAVFYLVASDYFQVVRLKGLLEFWKIYRGGESRE